MNKLTPEQVRHEYDKIEEEHDDAINAADGRRAMALRKLRPLCSHPKVSEFGWCPDCGRAAAE